MSYEIIYDKQFVKVSEKVFIPIILVGSNNVYDHNNRRARDWSRFGYLLNGEIAGTLQDMLDTQEKERVRLVEKYPGEYEDKSFGYYTSLSNKGGGCNMTYGQYIGISKTGCQKALTVEQLIEENVSVVFRTSAYSKEKISELGLDELYFVPKTTEELQDFLDNVAPKYSGVYIGVSLSGMFDGKPTRIRKKYFSKPKREKQRVATREVFVIEAPNGGYYYSGSGNGYKYTYADNGCKHFIDEKTALRTAKRLTERNGKEFKVKKTSFLNDVILYV